MCLCMQNRGRRSQARGPGVLQARPAKTLWSWLGVFPALRVASDEIQRMGYACRACSVVLTDAGSIDAMDGNGRLCPQGQSDNGAHSVNPDGQGRTLTMAT